MTILAAMQSAAMRLMGHRPSVFFGSQDKFTMEIADLVNEVAQDVVKSHDWQALKRIQTMTGDGTSDEFAFPADYDRMLLTAEMQDLTNWAWGYCHITDINDFMYQEASGFGPYPGGWIIYGDAFHFSPAPPAGQTASYPYISNAYAMSGGSPASAFTGDGDQFLLPERLLTLGLIWRWRENKKLDFTGDQEAFAKAIDEYSAKDAGARAYRSNSRRSLGRTRTAWPWTLGGS